MSGETDRHEPVELSPDEERRPRQAWQALPEAAGGQVREALLRKMLRAPYFAASPPKSTGRDLFNEGWLRRMVKGGARPRDVQATLLELTARSVAEAIARHCARPKRIIVCGGGVNNRALMRRLEELVAPATLESSARHGLDPQHVEATAFAWMAKRAIEGARGVPDFTFLLPNDLLLYMDVKFPFDNYVRFCESTSDLERKRHRDAFLRDVRARVRELSSREYVDPAGGTVDFVLLFVPNEQLYAFIHEQDETILDEAVRQQVVFCSPLTLFVVLALIRQMVENFQLARTSDEILALLGQFSAQWGKFKDQMAKVGARIDAAGKEYEALVTTRQITPELVALACETYFVALDPPARPHAARPLAPRSS